MTALRDNVVWVNSDRMLMRRDSEGSVMRVPGAPVANYRSIDLGLTGSGRLVLTYLPPLPGILRQPRGSP